MSFARQIANIPLRSPTHELRTDVVYDEVHGVPLRFDHYRALGGPEPTPCVVFVHGGGWVLGDPSHAAGNALHFARRGISTVSLSYRLAPQHRFPAQLDDVRRGLRWVRAHAAELHVDPQRLALMGMSAGAHLAMLAHVAHGIPALAVELPAELRDVPEDVRAVVLEYGPFDLARRKPLPDGSDPIAEFLGPRIADPEWVRAASPHYHPELARAPVLLVHGTGDTVVSHRQSQRMHEALLAAGRSSELLLLDGAPHAFQLEWRGPANRRALEVADAFLARHL